MNPETTQKVLVWILVTGAVASMIASISQVAMIVFTVAHQHHTIGYRALFAAICAMFSLVMVSTAKRLTEPDVRNFPRDWSHQDFSRDRHPKWMPSSTYPPKVYASYGATPTPDPTNP